jgi:hypothetical protein
LTGTEEAEALALDSANVYWVNDSGAPDPSRWVLRTLPKTGGTPKTVAAGDGQVNDLVADDEAVYLAVRTCSMSKHVTCSGSTDTVVRVSTVDGASTPLATGTGQLAVDDAWVYYLVVSDSSHGQVQKAPKRSGPAQVIASFEALYLPALNVFADTIYWAGSEFRDGQSQGVIRAAPKNGGSASDLAGGYYVRMKSDFDFLYARDYSTGSVYRIDRRSGQVTPIQIWQGSSTSFRDDVDAHSGVVYWNDSAADQHPGCVHRANADGTEHRCLDEGNFESRAVRVDDTAVYYVKNRAIWRVGK